MSRRLFATRIATARRPITTPHHHDDAVTVSTITNVVPQVASRPKKRNTITSPRPSDANGHGPPLYIRVASSASAPTARINTGDVATARTRPTTAAIATQANAALSTARG